MYESKNTLQTLPLTSASDKKKVGFRIKIFQTCLQKNTTANTCSFLILKSIPEAKQQNILDKKTGKYNFEWILPYTKFRENSVLA